MMTVHLQAKKDRLFDLLKSYSSVCIAYSGGVDSTLLSAVAYQALGERAVAATAVSPTHPEKEKRQAQEVALIIGIRHILFESREMDDSDFTANDRNRCYFCKRAIFEAMRALSQQLGLETLLHGANADDQGDFRPGQRAAEDYDVQAPLAAAGFTKDDIRRLSRLMGLPNWNRPAMSCLATRLPYGRPIEVHALERISKAEDFVEKAGIANCRVRHYDNQARIEVPPDAIAHVCGDDVRRRIVKYFRSLGYDHISVDLEGYKSGKMNRSIET